MEQLAQYIIALANLYGMVAPHTILDIYNHHHEAPVSLCRVEEIYDKMAGGMETVAGAKTVVGANTLAGCDSVAGSNTMASEIKDAFIHAHKGFFVHEAVLEHDEFDSLLDIKDCKPFYVPEKWDLLNYLDECYVQPTREYTALIYFVKEHFYPENTMDTQNQVLLGDGEFLEESVFLNSGLVSDSNIISDVGWVADGWYNAERVCRDIHGTCKFGGDISDVIWLLDDFGITIENIHQTNELTQLVEEFSEKIRMWEYNGLSRCEIEGLEHMEGEEDVYLEGEGEVGIEGEEYQRVPSLF